MGQTDQDEALIDAALDGSARAWERLVKRYEGRVYNFALRLMGNQTDALDLMQEVFLGVYRNLHRFRGESLFTTWLFRIAHNKAVDMNRRHRQRRRPEADGLQPEDVVEPSGAPSEPAPDPLERQRLYRGLEQLEADAPEAAAVIRMKHLDERTFDEIAALRGVPVTPVKTRYYRGMERLRQILRDPRTDQGASR